MSAYGTPSSRFPTVSRGATMRVTDQVFLTGNGYQPDLSENFMQQRFSGTTYSMKGQGSMVPMQKKAQIIYNRCMNNLEMAQSLMEQGGTLGDFDNMMAMASEDLKQLHQLVAEAKSYGQNPDYIIRSVPIEMDSIILTLTHT
ncbi:hypothetical protein PDJAM_G00195270 [Pangasius djambal]|uniref:Uncharacterized protein n=1 Tax=Pangasius djambal TaxID=1691987 RepID=A0ACC5Y6R7_9TELE|nr:hypothetical protein [Pangasius djambal]